MSTFVDDKFKEVYHSSNSVLLPFVSCMALGSFIVGKHQLKHSGGAYMIGIGYFCTTVLVFLTSLSKETNLLVNIPVTLVLSSCPLYAFYLGVKAGRFLLMEENLIYTEIVSDGFKCVGVTLFVVIGAAKVKSKICLTFLTCYATSSFTMLLVASFFLDHSSSLAKLLIWLGGMLSTVIG